MTYKKSIIPNRKSFAGWAKSNEFDVSISEDSFVIDNTDTGHTTVIPIESFKGMIRLFRKYIK